MKTLFTFSICLLISCALQAQSGSAILENYIREGLQQNLAVKTESIEIDLLTESLKQAKSLFYPRVSFNPTYSLAAGGRKLEFPVGDMLNPAYKTLNQLTGTESFPTNIKNINELLAPNNFHDTRFTVSYSIFNSDIRYNYRIQKDLISARESRKSVVENELRYEISAAYYQYLQTLDLVRIYENARIVLVNLAKFNEKLVSNHTATGEIVSSANYEVSKMENQIAAARRDRETARAYFNFLTNADPNRPIEVDSLKWNLYEETGIIENFQETALENRKEITALGSTIHAAETAVRMNESNAALPNLYVGGSTGFQGFGYTFKNQAYYALQFGLKWDIFSGSEKRSKIQQAKIRTTLLRTQLTSVENQIHFQVEQAYLALEAAKETLKSSQSGITSTTQTFRIIEKKYHNGQALLIEFLRAQNDCVTAQLQQSIAIADLFIKRAALNKAAAAH